MTGDDSTILDRVTFDDFAALFAADELDEVIVEWQAECTSALTAIEDALAREDRATIGEIAHRLTGGAQALGAVWLPAACQRLRARAESGEPVDEPDLASLRAAMTATQAALSAAVSHR